MNWTQSNDHFMYYLHLFIIVYSSIDKNIILIDLFKMKNTMKFHHFYVIKNIFNDFSVFSNFFKNASRMFVFRFGRVWSFVVLEITNWKGIYKLCFQLWIWTQCLVWKTTIQCSTNCCLSIGIVNPIHLVTIRNKKNWTSDKSGNKLES